MRRVKIGIIFVGLLTGLILGTFAFAQERGVTISPLNFDFLFLVGASIKRPYLITGLPLPTRCAGTNDRLTPRAVNRARG